MPSEIVIVDNISKLPASVDGAIELLSGVLYLFTQVIDLDGDTLYPNAAILAGTGKEHAGLTNGSVIFSASCDVRYFQFLACDVQINSDGGVFDWNHVNFVDCSLPFRIVQAENCVLETMGFLNSRGIMIDGEVNSVVLSPNCIFVGNSDDTAALIDITENAVINRRLRVQDSVINTSVVGQVGLRVSPLATIGDEKIIFNTVNFGGVGTALDGINGDSDQALFFANRGTGVTNSAVKANLLMSGNTTPTTVASAGVEYEVAGTKTVSSFLERFALNTNRLKYTSELPRQIKIEANMTLTCAANNSVGAYICIKRGGGTPNPVLDKISDSESYITTNGTRPDFVGIHTITSIGKDDLVYLAVENKLNVNNITVERINLIITEV